MATLFKRGLKPGPMAAFKTWPKCGYRSSFYSHVLNVAIGPHSTAAFKKRGYIQLN